MTNPNDTYASPLAARNASPEMLRIWSPRHKFNTWRRIWLAVAEAQQACGLEITDEQISELRQVVERGISDAEITRAAELERDLRHDVMAHVHCLGEQAPRAKGIVHLGMTSQDVVCNADLLIIDDAWTVLDTKCKRAVIAMADAAARFKEIATLGFTHYQAAQPTTVGRRLAGWAYDLDYAISTVDYRTTFRGFKGATGTQASFLRLFEGDIDRVNQFESEAVARMRGESMSAIVKEWHEYRKWDLEWQTFVAKSHGRTEVVEKLQRDAKEFSDTPFEEYAKRVRPEWLRRWTFDLTGQTYPRVHDAHLLGGLAATAAVLHKIATDIRLLSNRKELDEPFGEKQIGSSAMPYKRNPMKCERICGLTRFVMNLVGNAYDTAATQWLERTLDDSANRRLSLPEAFLALDGALDLMHQVASGLVVHEAMVRRNLMAELPFLATENILMAAVKAGADRQDYHEKIRAHAQAAGMRVKQEGLDNDLLDRLRADPDFHPPALTRELDWEGLMDPMKYIGRSVEQTERFLAEVIEPLRQRYGDEIAKLGGSDRGV
jgi:adenylosuccinate lyase